MHNNFDIESYMAKGVEKVVKSIVKSSMFLPNQSVFMAKYAIASKEATKKRKEYADKGTHIPPFLIASITSKCNLHCAGCYARSLHTCNDGAPVNQMTREEWGDVFHQASELGIGFILLAGGEPFVRRDVIEEAAEHKNILFPIFTNGTMLTGDYMDLIDKNRNLVPIISIEGSLEQTNLRRGEGVYQKLLLAMDEMNKKRIAFGASITVTKENIEYIQSHEFITELYDKGCKAVIYVEYVPVTKESECLAPDNEDREDFESKLQAMRLKYDNMVFLSFPGDEKNSDGCLAAGRGFFHINSHGGAEPCPFSPYSDISLKNATLLEVINSKLFKALREGDMLIEDHKGGCVLYEKRELVEALLKH